MNNNEKTLLLQLILKDIRGNWGWNLQERVEYALSLAEQLNLDKHIESLTDYITACEDRGEDDGRYFRMSYKHGGYEGMEVLHGLTPTFKDKSEEFKNSIGILTYPEYRFDDWEDIR